MIRRRRPAALFVTALLAGLTAAAVPDPARAQPPAPPAQAEPALPRWDASAMLGWRGTRVERDDIYDDWDGAFAYVGTVGFYWTPHLKGEIEIGGTARSDYFSYAPRTLPNQSFPSFVQSEHRVSGTAISGRALYQFFENEWFHPFAGAGVGLDRVRHEIHTPRQTFGGGVRRPDGTLEPAVVIEEERRTETRRDAKAQMILGFKAYPSEYAFMRTDVIWSVGASRHRYLSWRIGAGFDF